MTARKHRDANGVPYHRPKRKADLIRHLEQDHRLDYGLGEVRIVNPNRWTVAALHDEHDGLHAKRAAR